MDFKSILIIASIVISTLLMIIGPYLEYKGKISFIENKNKPITKKRYGMAIMFISALLFVIGLIMRTSFTSAQVTPIVIIGYVLWFVGGIIAVIRNETLKIMIK
ncbi:MAG: hypothetical protein PWP27_1637 [Clostridiales bacterium]|nr:hypothetical protein [Clostridiales bacterium]